MYIDPDQTSREPGQGNICVHVLTCATYLHLGEASATTFTTSDLQHMHLHYMHFETNMSFDCVYFYLILTSILDLAARLSALFAAAPEPSAL